jgi:hypothetical protein
MAPHKDRGSCEPVVWHLRHAGPTRAHMRASIFMLHIQVLTLCRDRGCLLTGGPTLTAYRAYPCNARNTKTYTQTAHLLLQLPAGELPACLARCLSTPVCSVMPSRDGP